MIDSLGMGGAQKMVVLLGRMCVEKDIPFTVISLANDPDCDNAGEIKSYGGQVIHFPGNRLLDPRRLAALSRYFRQEKVRLVHSYLTYANIVGSISGVVAGIPVICSRRNLKDSPLHFSTGRYILETLCLNFLAKRVMANGYAIAEANNRRLLFTSIDVIPNAIILPDLISMEERLKIRGELVGDASRSIVFSSGRLFPVKRFEDIIAAVQIVRASIPDICLVIAGEGISRAGLEKRIRDLDLAHNVILTGYRDDVPRLLMASDVYVNASSMEGMSVAILEAMAAGLPVIATDVGDTGRVVVDGTGRLIPRHRPDMIASTLLDFFKNPKEMHRMGENARERIRLKYNADDWLESMLALYQSAISKE